MSKCLYCYGELQPNENSYHHLCIRRAFSAQKAPQLPYTSQELAKHAGEGLSIDKGDNRLCFAKDAAQFSLRVADGDLALLEAVTMRMADVSRIGVAPHTLVRSSDGALHHLTRDIGCGKKGVQVEILPLAELMGDSNDGSYEAVAAVLQSCSTTPKLDIINLYERLLFSYLVGATQLDLSSFAMAKTMCGSSLAPATTIMPSALVGENSEMAMTLQSKRNELTREDFERAMLASGLEKKIVDNLFAKFERSIDMWCDVIDSSPLSDGLKDGYKFQIVIRFDTL